MIPISEYAQALKLVHLLCHPLPRVFSTGLSKLFAVHWWLVFMQFRDFQFDRQTMTIPAWHKRTVLSAHPIELDNQVFQNLIHNMTQMDRTVRIYKVRKELDLIQLN